MNRASQLDSVPGRFSSVGPALEVELTMPSEVAAISPATDKVMALVKETHGVAGKETDIELALREALANAVIHGNRRDPRKKVYIHCRLQPGSVVTLVVRDEGRGFDLREVTRVRSNGNGDSQHHLGIHLMRQLMDEVRFQRGGAEIQLRKQLDR